MYVIYTKIFHICKDFLKTPEKKSGTCLLQGNKGLTQKSYLVSRFPKLKGNLTFFCVLKQAVGKTLVAKKKTKIQNGKNNKNK